MDNYPPGVNDNEPNFDMPSVGDGEGVGEWPEIIGEMESCEEYSRISEAVGELTSAMLDAKMKGLLIPEISKSLWGFLEGVQKTLEEHMVES